MTCNSWPNSQSLSRDSHWGWFYLKQKTTWNMKPSLCKLLQLLTTWALYLRSTHLMCLGFSLHQIGIHLQDLDIVNATSNLVLTINIKKIWKFNIRNFCQPKHNIHFYLIKKEILISHVILISYWVIFNNPFSATIFKYFLKYL